jgi:hypothetical protein
MSTKVQLGETGQAVVGSADLAANVAVALDASGLLVVCAAGQRCIGTVQDPYKAGVEATYYKCRGNQHYVSSTGVAAGDYLKVGSTAGQLAPDTTTGSTTASINTVGQAVTATNTAGYCDAILF